MKKNLSALDMHYLLKELQILIDAKISKIIHLSKNELYLVLHLPNIGKKILYINAGKQLNLTDKKPSVEKPSGFCTFLRKKLNNARLRKVEQKEFERIIEFTFEKEEKFSLVVEMFGGGNILLLKDGIILSAVLYQKWKDRTVKPKEKYIYPKKDYDIKELTKDGLRKMLKSSEQQSLVKALALELGLGGTYAEELCFISDIDKNTEPKKVKDIKKLHDKIGLLLNQELQPTMYEDDFAPFKLNSKKDKSKKLDNFSDTINKYFSKLVIPKKSEHEKKIEKQKKLIKEQEENITRD